MDVLVVCAPFLSTFKWEFFSFEEEKLFGQAETEYVHFMAELSLLQEGQEKGKEAGRQCQGLVGG